MSSFFELDFAQNLPIDDYLGTVVDTDELSFTASVLTDARAFLSFLLTTRRIRAIPEIRIRNSMQLNAEGMDGVVIIHSGLVLHAFKSCFLDSSDAKELVDLHGFPAPEYTTRCIFLLWAISHELTHAHRQHHDVLLAVGANDPVAQQATEMDADLCATAHVFRWLQNSMPAGTDPVQIKCLVLRGLHYAIREFPDARPGSGHHSTVHRLFEIVCKLGMLRANPFDPPDRDFKTTESHQAQAAINRLYIILETARAERLGISTKEYFKETAEFIDDRKWEKLGDKWEEIKGEVSQQSNTRT